MIARFIQAVPAQHIAAIAEVHATMVEVVPPLVPGAVKAEPVVNITSIFTEHTRPSVISPATTMLTTIIHTMPINATAAITSIGSRPTLCSNGSEMSTFASIGFWVVFTTDDSTLSPVLTVLS